MKASKQDLQALLDELQIIESDIAKVKEEDRLLTLRRSEILEHIGKIQQKTKDCEIFQTKVEQLKKEVTDEGKCS